ncbi:MAG: hypothetical protein ABW146_14710 [Candidatus Sedimenticola sp. 6PFRAG7]
MTDDRKEPYMEAERPFSVDDEGIPILNDVVGDWQAAPGEGTMPGSDRRSGHNLGLPDHDELVAVLRSRLKNELGEELDTLIEQVAAETVSSVMDEFSSVAQKKLTRLLKKRSDELLERIMDEEFSKSR